MFRTLILPFWRFFCSLRLTVVVISSIILSVFVGMFWDQTKTLEEHLAEFSGSPIVQKIVVFFELNDIFHSWWFSILVLFLALNLIACSIQRLPILWIQARNPVKRLDSKSFNKASYHVTLPVKRRDVVESALRKIGFESYGSVGSQYWFFDKHRYARTGVYLIHISLLTIMFSSIATTLFGLEGMMSIIEGQGSQFIQAKGPGGLPYNHALSFRMVCEDFRLRTFVDGSPLEFESDVAVYDPPNAQEPLLRHTLRVNEPLTHRGYTFYQASYQPLQGEGSIWLEMAHHGGKYEKFETQIGKKIEVNRVNYIPLEMYDEYGGYGPALKIQMQVENKEPSTFIIFRQYPEFDEQVRRGAVDFKLAGFDNPFITGISVLKSPYLNAVFFGFILMFVGMYMAFLMNYRKYYATMEEQSHGDLVLHLALVSHKKWDSVQLEWESMLDSFPKEG